MKYVLMAGAGYGYGDALCLLSVAQTLKSQNHEVAVLTGHPEVYDSQPGIDRVYSMGAALGMWEDWCKDGKVINFPYWEITGRMRGLPDTLLNVFRGMAGLDKATEFPTFVMNESDMIIAAELRHKLQKPLVVVHRGKGREIKLIPMSSMIDIVNELKHDYDVAQIGYKFDDKIPGTIDLRQRMTFRQSMAVMMDADFIVGHDSMPAHASGIVQTPGVFIYGPTSPVDFGYTHNENIFTGYCSKELSAPCGRPCTWHYDYVSSIEGGYKDWDCDDRWCIKGVGAKEVLERIEILKSRLKQGIDWTPKRG